MLCEVCGCKLANSNIGKAVHMKRYHAVRSSVQHVQPMPPTHKVTKEEKEAAIRKFEEKHKDLFVDDTVTVLLPYGQVRIDRPSKPVQTWKEFNDRLDALVEQSDKLLKQLKEKFGE